MQSGDVSAGPVPFARHHQAVVRRGADPPRPGSARGRSTARRGGRTRSRRRIPVTRAAARHPPVTAAATRCRSRRRRASRRPSSAIGSRRTCRPRVRKPCSYPCETIHQASAGPWRIVACPRDHQRSAASRVRAMGLRGLVLPRAVHRARSRDDHHVPGRRAGGAADGAHQVEPAVRAGTAWAPRARTPRSPTRRDTASRRTPARVRRRSRARRRPARCAGCR